MKITLLCTMLWAAFNTASRADDWPQFCGPNRNNISAETGLADSWPESGPRVLWETEVHAGYSGPAVKDGKVYLIDREELDTVLRCMELETGKELWNVGFEDPAEMSGAKFAGTRGTPTVTDEAIFMMTGYGTLARVDPGTKKVLWKRNLLKDFEVELHGWGIAQAPLIYGDTVIIGFHTPDSNVFAFDAVTGKEIWRSPKIGLHGYVSPQVVSFDGMDMVVAVGSNEEPPKSRKRRGDDDEETPPKKLQEGHVVGLDPKDGSIIWDYSGGWACKMVIPHPLQLSEGRLFLTGGYDAGSAMIRIEKAGDGYAVKELYRTDEVGAQLQQPIQVGDILFIGSNSNSRRDGLASFHIDGKLQWRTKDVDDAPNFERGPFILSDGKLILLDGKTGILHLVKADPAVFSPLASAKMVKENDMAWAPLALSDGKLLVRDWTTLKCVDLR